ncbi:MAG: cytochrome C [Edaphobacter sp.]|uniref:cytochrome C n=1 Tax=Edaphobacter sp. TaxID=1934404 RepID=UPI002386CD22|nr:cytochrome C [Edaphobacter sp.]MDE1177164.1 cytochrome C [Edaphobacter sp.]
MQLISRYLLLTASLASVVAWGQTPSSPLPEGAHRETVQRACSSCHAVQMFSGRRMTRQQWGATVSDMIGRGAKVTDDEFDEIVGYLATAFPLNGDTSAGTAATKQTKAPRKPSLIDQAGSQDKQIVDEDAAALGRTVYIAQCITCHGTRARGGSRGADLVRSVLVLHDRYGSTIGPYLAKGHPSTKPVDLTKDQVVNLSHFLHQQIGDTLRTGPYNNVGNILVGDAKAGELYFEGAGGCTRCHSATGDLAHIASKYDPPVLQQKFVFPENRAITKQGTASRQHGVATVTVTTSSGTTVTGEPLNIDDFNVSLRDATGRYFSFKRSPDLKVEKHNPYAGHEALLETYTDKDIHDVVSYLETLQ